MSVDQTNTTVEHASTGGTILAHSGIIFLFLYMNRAGRKKTDRDCITSAILIIASLNLVIVPLTLVVINYTKNEFDLSIKALPCCYFSGYDDSIQDSGLSRPFPDHSESR